MIEHLCCPSVYLPHHCEINLSLSLPLQTYPIYHLRHNTKIFKGTYKILPLKYNGIRSRALHFLDGVGTLFLKNNTATVKHYTTHNCFGPPSLLVEGLLSMGPTPSSFTSWLRWGSHYIFFQHTCCEN